MTQESPIQYEEVVVEVPGWPKVLGIISICWGVLSLGCVGCGLLGPALQSAMIPPEQAKDFPVLPPDPAQYAQLGLGGVFAVLLIVAGAMTAGRHILGRTLHLVYAVAAFPLLGLAVWVTMRQQAAMNQWIADNPDSQFAGQMKAMSGVSSMLGIGLSIIFGLAYPIFLLVWFGAVKRTHASMTGMPAESPEQG